MLKKFLVITTLSAFILTSLIAQSATPKRKKAFKNKSKDGVIRSEAGLKIPDWGISIDATFDPELTNIIPGYHIVNIILSNHRGSPIKLNKNKDKWTIIDSKGKKHTAFNHVDQFDDQLWAKLPQNLKNLIAYPSSLHPGKAVTIDVFVNEDTDLFNFKEIKWKSSHFGKNFSLMTNYEDSISVADAAANREITIPRNSINADELMKLQEKQTKNMQKAFVNSKYRTHPNINDVTENTAKPLFDPSLDDMIIMD